MVTTWHQVRNLYRSCILGVCISVTTYSQSLPGEGSVCLISGEPGENL